MIKKIVLTAVVISVATVGLWGSMHATEGQKELTRSQSLQEKSASIIERLTAVKNGKKATETVDAKNEAEETIEAIKNAQDLAENLEKQTEILGSIYESGKLAALLQIAQGVPIESLPLSPEWKSFLNKTQKSAQTGSRYNLILTTGLTTADKLTTVEKKTKPWKKSDPLIFSAVFAAVENVDAIKPYLSDIAKTAKGTDLVEKRVKPFCKRIHLDEVGAFFGTVGNVIWLIPGVKPVCKTLFCHVITINVQNHISVSQVTDFLPPLKNNFLTALIKDLN